MDQPGPTPEAEIRELRERVDRVEQAQAPKYDPPFLARVWLFLAVLVVLALIGALIAWIF
jgi:hypothetical protein